MATTVDYILKVSAKEGVKSLGEVAKGAFEANKKLVMLAGTAVAGIAAFKTLASVYVAMGEALISVAKATVEFAQESADLVNDINDLSNRSAIAADTIKGLQFALQASGQSASQATAILSKFPSVLALAEEESSRTAEGFKKLGIEIKNTDGSLRPANEIFLETLTRLQSIEDQTERTKAAFEIFGRSAGQLLQALGQTKGLETFIRLTEKFGVRTGPKASDAAADFQAVIAALDTVMKGIKSTFIETFGPEITKLIIDFATEIAFVQRVIVLFSDDVSKAFSSIITALKVFFELGVGAVKTFGVSVASQIPFIGSFAGLAIDLADQFDLFDKALGKLAANTIPEFSSKINQAYKDAKEFRNLVEGLIEGEFTKPSIQGGGGGGGGGGSTQAATKNLAASISNLPLIITDGFKAGSMVLFESYTLFEKIIRNTIVPIQKASEALQTMLKMTSPQGFLDAVGKAFSNVTGGISELLTGAITGIASLGEKTPKEIQQDFDNFVKAFSAGLEMLPRILIQVLPKFVIQLTAGILKGILKLPFLISDAIGELFVKAWTAIKEFFKSIFTKEGRQERREQRRARKRRGERNAVGQFFEDLANTSDFYMSGGIYSAQSGIRFTGGKRGLAMLHEGEAVIPASGRTGQAEQRSFNQSGGGGINIVINSAVVENRAIDELVRKLENRFGTFGVGKSSLFGR